MSPLTLDIVPAPKTVSTPAEVRCVNLFELLESTKKKNVPAGGLPSVEPSAVPMLISAISPLLIVR